ncbi:uncharacterized protein LOC128650281 [Bombina bombina]|uniref:uncharacterized protein LOC128650281 n=1 Tax=Bombina bombina TaxID=8345 RepID=UPI00235AB6E6|nr:uncharacterized protein LOC128650281 [Bombina bombina]
MASVLKKARKNEAFTVLIRMCDSFVRTPENIICPLMKAKESLRILYKLQEHLLRNIVSESGDKFGLLLSSINWIPLSDKKTDTEGNIFIRYTSSKPLEENQFRCYREQVKLRLQQLGIQHILIHQLENQLTVSQPLISEIDFKIHKLNLLYKILQEKAESFPIELQSIGTQLSELQESRIRIAILSHNGTGKSYVLNLLFLLTAETLEEYQKNKARALPKDIAGNPTVRIVKEEHFANLPEVIKDFITEINDDEQDFKNLMQPLCSELNFTSQEELRKTQDSFDTLDGYFTEDEQISIEPYLLPQKDITGAYLSTTKCVIHLRYGASFQMRVDYFNERELQTQLFELVSLNTV